MTKQEIKKKLKDYMQNRYLDILHYLLSDANDAEENVLTLIKYEPYFFTEIEQIKTSRAYLLEERKFQKQVDMSILDAERYLMDAKKQRLLLNEALERTQKMQPVTPKAIKYKNGRIKHLQSRLASLAVTENQLAEIAKAQTTEKRPVGRPKKSEVDNTDDE